MPHPVIQNYLSAFEQARFVDAELLEGPDHALSHPDWQRGFRLRLLSWLTARAAGKSSGSSRESPVPEGIQGAGDSVARLQGQSDQPRHHHRQVQHVRELATLATARAWTVTGMTSPLQVHEAARNSGTSTRSRSSDPCALRGSRTFRADWCVSSENPLHDKHLRSRSFWQGCPFHAASPERPVNRASSAPQLAATPQFVETWRSNSSDSGSPTIPDNKSLND